MSQSVKLRNQNGQYMVVQNLGKTEGARVVMSDEPTDQRWIMKDEKISMDVQFSTSIAGDSVVLGEPRFSESKYKEWKLEGNSIVCCDNSTICLQVSDNGTGEKVSIGELKEDSSEGYQTWYKEL